VATAFEIVNPGSGLPAAAVELVISDQNGNSSQAMIQGVTDNLLTYRAAGIPVFVSGGQIQYEQVVYDLDFQAGIDTVGRVMMSSDEKAYVYSYVRTLSDLYLVQALN